MYRYLHDQTLRLANQGHTMTEIAEMIRLPEGLAKEFYCRGYYGSVNHDVKAVYVKYLGWFDGNPANLHPLPPLEAASGMWSSWAARRSSKRPKSLTTKATFVGWPKS